MQVYASYEKEQALSTILEHFDYDLEELSRKELQAFAFEEIAKISYNTTGREISRFKIFTIYQVAVIFIYQELTNSSSQALFDACINTSKYKESIASLVPIACEFGNAYRLDANEDEVAYLNKILIQEVKKAKIDKNDNSVLEYTYQKLFNEDASCLAQDHILKMIEIENKFSQEFSSSKKLLVKEDIFSLLVLFQMYHDDVQLAEYEKIKALCNLPDSDKLLIKEEIKYIANDYMQTKDKKYLRIFNDFFLTLSTYIKNRYFLRIDDEHINFLFEQITDEVREIKWYDKVLMKKDNYLLGKNTMQIQSELDTQQQNYSHKDLDTKIFADDFKVFYAVSVLAQEYDKYFNTVDRISRFNNEDFGGYYQANGMNIKNFYEKTKKPVEIESINRFLFFWIGFNVKSMQKKRGKKA